MSQMIIEVRGGRVDRVLVSKKIVDVSVRVVYCSYAGRDHPDIEAILDHARKHGDELWYKAFSKVEA